MSMKTPPASFIIFKQQIFASHDFGSLLLLHHSISIHIDYTKFNELHINLTREKKSIHLSSPL